MHQLHNSCEVVILGLLELRNYLPLVVLREKCEVGDRLNDHLLLCRAHLLVNQVQPELQFSLPLEPLSFFYRLKFLKGLEDPLQKDCLEGCPVSRVHLLVHRVRCDALHFGLRHRGLELFGARGWLLPLRFWLA